jgi:hypothetical protein
MFPISTPLARRWIVVSKDNLKNPSRRQTFLLLAASAGAAVSFPIPSEGEVPSPSLSAQGYPTPGAEVDLASFGHSKSWDGNPGVEWDEPRDVWRVEVDFFNLKDIPSTDALQIEYWVRSWPPVPSGGWTKIDTPLQGEWRRIRTRREVRGKTLMIHFLPLSEAENPNVQNAPGYAPLFRRTLKIRLHFKDTAAVFKRFRVYSDSRWAVAEISVETGCEGKTPFQAEVTAYNGYILNSTALQGTPSRIRLKVLYTDHTPSSNDRTILTVHGAPYDFGVSVDDVLQRKAVYVKPLGVFIGDFTTGERFDDFAKSARMRPGEDIISRVSRHPEQSLDNAMGEIPRLALTARAGSHRCRYIPLGFTGSREKYGLDFNGNVFISKRGSKAMKEDLARMLWQGDEIYFRIGTGNIPDFREREFGTRQQVLEGYLPLITTTWETEGIEYEEQAYASLLSAPLDEAQLRGDEPSLLFLRLIARNASSEPREARMWFLISPEEMLEFRDGALLGTGNQEGLYPFARLRAAFATTATIPELQDTPPGSAYPGKALRWSVSLPPGQAESLIIKIPFRTMVAADEIAQVKSIHFDARLDETLAYWRKATSQGMQLHVPDEVLNRFFRSVLQHILVSQEKDPETGYTLCPCGTYDYNVFANETDIQVRLLNMRGLHEAAWRCLRPLVELQGSEPFPGRFRDTSAELHGVRVDKDHDYTMGGYNLDHGWTLWTLADHYFFHRDQDWLRRVMPHLIKAANWIIEERKITMRRDSQGAPVPEFGLLPPGDLEDNNDWEHWFAVNGYAYRGLARAAEAVAEMDAAEGARLKKEAETYRQDIRVAALQAMAMAPVVSLRDGTAVPMIPPRTSLHGRDLGWIRNVLYGAHTLVDCGVFSPDEPVATWMLQDYEDNLFMALDSLSVPERDWFSRGGVALQPNLVNTFTSYLERDQLPQAIRAFYNDFAISYYPDVNCFTEWVPAFGIGGGPFFKTSDESAFLIWLRLILVREHGNRLYLNSGAPRSWFLPGRIIEVERAASFFGEMGFRVESHPERGFIEAQVSLPQRNRPAEVHMRLRHPDGKKIARVELNGRSWDRFDREQEMISLAPEESSVFLRASY